jgi:hypothetical protein
MTESLLSVKEAARLAGEFVGIFIVGASVGVWGAIRRQRAKLRWNSKRERKFVEKHSRIHEMLTELRVTVQASRAIVFQFHNGGSFVDGGSIKRFSVTHESCEAGTTSVVLDSQDVLLTRYTNMIGIMDSTPSAIIAVSSMPVTPFRSALEINKVEYFTISPLRCDDGITPLGFLCCHWCSGDTIEEINQEGISDSKIEGVIEQATTAINAYLIHKTGIK